MPGLEGCKISNGSQRLCINCDPIAQKKCKMHFDDNQRIIREREKIRQGRSPQAQADYDNYVIVQKKLNQEVTADV